MWDRPPGLKTEWHFGRTHGSLLFIAWKLNLMSDSVCVLDGALPILKAFLKIHGCVWLQTSGKQTGSSKQYNIVCNSIHIPFIILLRLEGWDLIYYTPWHLVLNINFFLLYVFSCSLPTELFAGVSWLYFHTGVMARLAKLKKRRKLSIYVKEQFVGGIREKYYKVG